MSYKPVSLTSLSQSSSSPSTSCSKHLDSLFSSSSADSELEHYELYHKFDSLKMTNEHLSDEIVCKENDFSNLPINENLNETFDVEEGRQGTLNTRDFNDFSVRFFEYFLMIYLLFC